MPLTAVIHFYILQYILRLGAHVILTVRVVNLLDYE